jgi:hypothetical protein
VTGHYRSETLPALTGRGRRGSGFGRMFLQERTIFIDNYPDSIGYRVSIFFTGQG